MQWFFRQFARLPLSWLHALGIVTGWLVFWTSSGYAARMRENISHSGLCASPDACRQLLHQAIGEAGKSVLELPAIWLRPYEDVLGLVRKAEGWDKVEALARDARDQFAHIAEMIPSIPRELVSSVQAIEDPLQSLLQ